MSDSGMHHVIEVRVRYIWVLCHSVNTDALSSRGLGHKHGYKGVAGV